VHQVVNHKFITQLKSLPKQGLDPDAQNRQLQNELQVLSDSLPTITSLLDNYQAILGKVSDENTKYSMGLGKVIAIQQNFAEGINKLVQNITFLEESNKSLNKGYGLTSISAARFADQLRNVSIAGKIGSDKIMKYANDLHSLTGGFLSSTKANDAFGKKLLQAQQFMQNNLGVTSAAAEGFEYYGSTIAGSGAEALVVQEKLSKVLSDKTGLDSEQIQKDLVEGIGSAGAEIQLQYGRIPGSLELAVLKAKALGTSMQALNKTGENLLNIEQSVGQELEYQLLSGKRLLTQDGKSLTNAYRQATIQGDANKQADLMNHFIKEQGPMLEKNLYARKKAAELMGTDEASLARMIQKQKLVSKLGIESLLKLNKDDITATVADLRKEGKVSEEDIQKLLDDSDNRTSADRSADYLKSIDETIKKGAGIKVGAVSTKVKGTVESQDVKNAMTQLSSTAIQKQLGAMSITGQTLETLTTPIKTVADGLGTFASALSTAIETTTGILPKFATGDTGTSEAQIKPVGINDALIVPNRGPILRPAPNDVIAAFRPNDVIDRTLNSKSSNSRTTNNMSAPAAIDYVKLASAIASAMQNIKVEATIKTDNLFAATKQNMMGKSFS